MNEPRDHHFIPAFLLRRWHNPQDQKLIDYRKVDIGKGTKIVSKPRGGGSTGWQTDLNRIIELPPGMQYDFESKHWSDHDQLAADALESLEKGTIDTRPDLKEARAGFLVSLRMRHPEALPEFKAFVNGIWDNPGPKTEKRYSEIRTPSSPATFAEVIKTSSPESAAFIKFGMLLGAVTSENVRALVGNYTWKVIDVAAAPRTLLLSDWPIDIQTKITSDKTGVAVMPISPTRLFVASENPVVVSEAEKEDPTTIVDQVNWMVVRYARRHVFAYDYSHDKFIQANMGATMDSPPFFPALSDYN